MLNREVMQLFTNNRASVIRGRRKYKKPHPIFLKTPYADLYYGHDIIFLKYIKGKTILIYRNPLDYLISWYHYRYKKRASDVTLEECIRDWLPRWIDRYLRIRELRDRQNVLAIAYEELVSYPDEIFSRILQWLDIPVRADAVQRALQFSSIEALRKEEKEHGPIQGISTFEGSFIRSGRVGNWRKNIGPELLRSVIEELRKHDIEISEFILEDPDLASDAEKGRSPR